MIERFVRPGDLAIDAGASLGHHTVLLSKLVGEAGRVLAFEPEARELRAAGPQRRRARQRDVPADGAVVPRRAGTAAVVGPRRGPATRRSTATTTPSAWKVEARALDGLIPAGEQPRFIKIDCEGAEEEILRGAERVLRTAASTPWWSSSNHDLLGLMGRTDHAVRDYMARARLRHVRGRLRRPDPGSSRPSSSRRLEGGHAAVNVLFSREEQVRARW